MQRKVDNIHPEYVQEISKIFTCTYESELSLQEKENLAKAVAAYYFVSRTVVYGASNRVDDLVRTGLFVVKQVRDARENNFASTQDRRIRCGAMNSLTYRAGNCAEQTHLAIIYLLSRGCYSLHLFSMEGGDHAFASIGLNENSDLAKQQNIPADAIIIDLWANDIYFAKEFVTKIANAKSSVLTKGTPVVKWSFQRDGLSWLPDGISKEKTSELLKQFLIDHASISEKELRDQNLISGLKPQKTNQAALMEEIRTYEKFTLFKYKKDLPVERPKTYANDNGFKHLIEKMADNILGLYFINDLKIESITLDTIMPLSRIPDFDIRSLNKEMLNQHLFVEKFKRMFNHYYTVCESSKSNSYFPVYEKLKELVGELENIIQSEILKRRHVC